MAIRMYADRVNSDWPIVVYSSAATVVTVRGLAPGGYVRVLGTIDRSSSEGNALGTTVKIPSVVAVQLRPGSGNG